MNLLDLKKNMLPFIFSCARKNIVNFPKKSKIIFAQLHTAVHNATTCLLPVSGATWPPATYLSCIFGQQSNTAMSAFCAHRKISKCSSTWFCCLLLMFSVCICNCALTRSRIFIMEQQYYYIFQPSNVADFFPFDIIAIITWVWECSWAVDTFRFVWLLAPCFSFSRSPVLRFCCAFVQQ